MDAKSALEQYKQKVDAKLEEFFNNKLDSVAVVESSSEDMIKLLKEYTMRGGKRLRAAMVYYGYLCFADENPEIVSASMAIELVQSYLLIHDDFMDNDDLRRGGPTLHASYRDYSKKQDFSTDHNHFGASMAICAGDACSAFANEIIAETSFNPEFKINAIRIMNQMLPRVIYGQVLDILSTVKKDFGVKDVMQIQELKTAAYTVEGPLQIGASLAGASGTELQTISDFSLPLGQAFQIQDDILGMFGDEKKLGKTIGSDITEGKRTLLMVIALEKADEKQKQFLLKCLGNPEITEADIEKVRDIVKETGALEFSQKTAKDMISTAKAVIESSDLRPEGKEFLAGIADYMLEREY